MGTITALTAQVKNPDRVNVFIDGAFAVGLALSVAAGLRIGQEISQSELEQLDQRDEVHRARERVLRLLARRPYSSAEISRYLRRHQMDDEIIQNVIDDLTEAKLIDDDAFAAYWVEQRETFRPRSRLALRQELSQKGVEREIVAEALSDVNEIDAARRVARKQAGRWRGLAEAEWRTKMTRYLMRHGYPYDVVSEVVTETWLEVKPDEDE
ncbi:MAG: RecX family transcriptional regulator [Candidatus Promineofilum sp.]|uniref:RecX family transcriptional regulator n=1 Tax=Promineifilum sp. TaxID=2664178 RepID=UPI002411ECA7|nr:RecX family transcriptional regulator [Promineifilum sp.]